MENDVPASPLIDLNQANLETLTTLPGIGPALASRIVQFREEVRPFEEPIEVTAVPGISEGMYRRFADRVTVSQVGQVVDLTATDQPAISLPSAQIPEIETPLTSEPDTRMEREAVPHARPIPIDDAVAEPTTEVSADSSPVPVSRVPVEAEEKPKVASTPAAPLPPPQPIGSGCLRPWLLMIVSVLGGALLALLIIQSINGTLDMANHPRTVRLAEDMAALERQNETLNDEVRLLRSRLDQIEALSGRLTNAEADIQSMKEALATVDEQITTLEEDSAQIQESIELIQAATDRFDGFLNGLRDLLLATESTPTPAVTPADLINLSPTPTPTETTAAATATRTPRPTRIPTATPTLTNSLTPAAPTRTPSAFNGATDTVPARLVSNT